MMEIEKTNTEKMLREFWLIHSHFTEHPELLKDDNVSKVYDNLMSIRDVDGLKDWLRLKERIDTQSNEAVRYEDVLGRMYDLLFMQNKQNCDGLLTEWLVWLTMAFTIL